MYFTIKVHNLEQDIVLPKRKWFKDKETAKAWCKHMTRKNTIIVDEKPKKKKEFKL